MKLDLKKIGHNRDLWIVIGGAAAAVTAVAVLAGGRGKAASSSSTTDPYAQLPGGATSPDAQPANPHLGQDPILTAPPSGNPPDWQYTPYVPPPAPVTRAAVPVEPPAYYHDAKGNPATLEQIFAQKFPIAGSAPPPPPPPPTVIPAGPITWAPGYGPNGRTVAQSAAAAWASTSTVVTYPDPIVARNLKTPGGGLAYPAGTETFIGGGGGFGGDPGSGPLISA